MFTNINMCIRIKSKFFINYLLEVIANMEKITKNNISVENKDFIAMLMPLINSFYKKVNYLNISPEEIAELVVSELNKTMHEQHDDVSFTENVKAQIKLIFIKKIKEQLNDPLQAESLINTFINKTFKNVSTSEEELKNINKLATFFESFDYTTDFDILSKLIEQNEKLSRALQIVVAKHKSQITSGGLSDLFDNNLTASIIEGYCLINNIEIRENNDSYKYSDYEEEKEFEKIEYDDESSFREVGSLEAYFREINNHKPFSAEEQKDLARRAKHGDVKARQMLIESNLKLAVKMAFKYRFSNGPLIDLIQEGNIGLMKAADRYDPDMGCNFSTYAIWWIRQGITRYISNKSRNIRIPVHLDAMITKYKQTCRDLEGKLNRKPTLPEIARAMHISLAKVIKLDNFRQDTLSINKIIGSEDDTELEHFIADSDQGLEEKFIQKALASDVRKLFEKCNLSDREKEVLILRFGFCDERVYRLEEIGQMYNVTRERIRQIESNALKKLRQSEHIKHFANYMQKPDAALDRIDEFRKIYGQYSLMGKQCVRKLPKLENDKNDENDKNEKRDESMRRVQTIYEYFNTYSKEEVDAMISKLSDEERCLLTLKYGEDLNVQFITRLSKEQKSIYYGSLLPKMKRMLEKPNYTQRKRRRKIDIGLPSLDVAEKNDAVMIDSNSSNVSKVNDVKNGMSDDVTVEKNIQSSTEADLDDNHNVEVSDILGESDIENSVVAVQNNDVANNQQEICATDSISKDEYVKMLELIKTPSFAQMMTTLSVKDAVIISLRLGYIDGKYFSPESIANFLDIEPEEVYNRTTNILQLYKDDMNRFIDRAIEISTRSISTEKSKVLGLTNKNSDN